jgi:hypothetical protein
MSRVSCPICYESYDSSSSTLVARKLQCGDVMCLGCIEGNIFDSSFYCPECGQPHNGASALDFSVLYEPGLESDTSSESVPSVTIENNNLVSGTVRTPRKCAVSGCDRKSIGTDSHCLEHSGKKRLSLVKETEIANTLAETSLHHVTITGSKFKVKESCSEDSQVTYDDLATRFSKQSRMELGEAVILIDKAKAIMTREPNVLQLKAPLIIVGDIHGQFYDLMNIFKVGGTPGDKTYLFLGDYVDRGHFSCEVILSLLALKVAHPDR